MRLGYRAIFLGFFLTVLFSIISMYLELVVRNDFTVSDTLIPVLTYFFLILLLFIFNPILKLIYNHLIKIRLFRPFNRHEVLLVTMMTLVTSGISGFGLMNYLMPFIGTVNSPSRSTNQSDWGLLSQTVLKFKEGKDPVKVYGDVEAEDSNTITLRHYDGKSKGVDEIKVYQKSEVTIQRPLINPNLVLNRKDAEIFEKGLPQLEFVNKVTGKPYPKSQNSFPAYLPFPKETISDWKARIAQYSIDGKIQEGYSFWGSVPWMTVFPPFAYWLIFVLLLYLILFSLAKILFTQWAKYERLQFPLATIPQELMGEVSKDPASKDLPTFTIWRNVFFVVGFTLALTLILLEVQLPAYVKLSLHIKDYVSGTIFEGLKDSGVVFHVFFLLIGVAFMVPKEISFSVWFFGIVFLMQILFAVWFGFGKTATSFKTDQFALINFYTAQAFGGLIIFSLFALWNVRHYLLSGLYKILKMKPKSVKPEVIDETYIASTVFIIAGFGVFMFMLWMNISFWWACIYCAITLMFIIAAMRVASECGIIGFQNLAGGGAHFAGNVIGVNNLGVTSYINIIILQTVFFFDTKVFLGPNVMVAQKVEDENQISKKRFWIVLFSAVILSVITAFVFMSMLVYHNGSKGLQQWYFRDTTNNVYNASVLMIKNVNEPTINMNPVMSGFLFFGMVGMVALLFARTKWFWVPHPVGILLWISEKETKFFLFSFFLGWLIKFLVVKLGTKETIENMKKFAIGLIFGHITAIIIIGISKFIFDMGKIKATLNFH